MWRPLTFPASYDTPEELCCGGRPSSSCLEAFSITWTGRCPAAGDGIGPLRMGASDPILPPPSLGNESPFKSDLSCPGTRASDAKGISHVLRRGQEDSGRCVSSLKGYDTMLASSRMHSPRIAIALFSRRSIILPHTARPTAFPPFAPSETTP
jgi:hypothetical protein